MSLGTEDSRPPYLQVAERLKKRIASGEFKAGDRLPTNRELADQFAVAPNTVLNALRVLRDEGIITSQQGRGTFVRATPPPRSTPDTPPAEFTLIMDQLTKFQDDLAAMSERLTRLEELAARVITEDQDAEPTQ